MREKELPEKTGTLKALRKYMLLEIHEDGNSSLLEGGEVKDPVKKEHPCMVPYSSLPEAQRKKDDIFYATAMELMKYFDMKAW